MTEKFEPTDQEREDVQRFAGVGLPQDTIALLVRDGIAPKTLREHFRRELDFGKADANRAIGETLFDKATKGDTTSLIFWAKTQMGWKETNVQENTGEVTLIKRVIIDGNTPDTDS